jgi:hypothetical protein
MELSSQVLIQNKERDGLMRNLRVFESLICVTVVASLLMCAGCQGGPGNNPPPKQARRLHQLGLVCQPGQPSDLISIGVDATDQVLTDPNSSIIFACEGDQIIWSTSNAKIKITVNIKGPHAGELFTSHDTTIVWDPANPGAGPANQTPLETVDKPQNHIFLHKYSVDVEDLQSNPHKHYTIDPHVIPMGNGGP